MSKLIYKQFLVEKKTVDAEQGIFEAMITTESVDRDQDVIVAAGGDLESFRKNPVVLDSHMYVSGAVIGKSLKEEVIEGKGIKATFKFAPREISERADNIRKLWEGGFLNAVSIGFIAHDTERRTDENGEELRRGLMFNEWELLEFSIVPVPSNQDALRLGYKMMITQDEPRNTILLAEWDLPASEHLGLLRGTRGGMYDEIDLSKELTLEELALQFSAHFQTNGQKAAFDEFVDLVAGQLYDTKDNSLSEGDSPDSESNNDDDNTHLDYKEIGQKIKTLKEKVRSKT